MEVSLRAFIHTVGGTPFNEECASAQRGFELLGVETIPFSNNGVLDLATRNDVVVAGLLVCQHALRLQGVVIPSIDYPYNIREFLGRRIDSMPVAAIELADLPVFVKPAEEKVFLALLCAPMMNWLPTWTRVMITNFSYPNP